MRAIALICLFVCLLVSSAQAFTGITRGDLHGSSFKQDMSTSAVQPTIYLFVRPDCSSCALQISHLAVIQKQLGGIRVSLIVPDEAVARRTLLAGSSITAEVQEDRDAKIAVQYGLKSIPAIVFVDSGSVIRGFYEGLLSLEELEKLASEFSQGDLKTVLYAKGAPGARATPIEGVAWIDSRYTLLVFHQFDCEFCRQELPKVIQLSYDKPSLRMFVIAPSNISETQSQFKSAGAKNNIDILSDELSNRKIYNEYNVKATPTFILINELGEITWRLTGSGTGNTSLQKIPIR
ncbi:MULTISPECIES: thioredoxin fold domain-containing protein [unclassified Deinococcus]|uniref:thioredoxin fold domain-containing protein n=1 Tax=unclassified Deinococcus TaxID=2623546 RepID=UPI000992354F|nr:MULTISPECIES: thioredoxin fold domain-containing protein [unclassified Deinococcus]MBX8467221.1 redoxin domain-containing protein [Deinococcus sp. RIT780]